MSLLAPRLLGNAGSGERASVVLPTVKCSSCSVPIPLNELADHVCDPLSPLSIPTHKAQGPPSLASPFSDSPTSPAPFSPRLPTMRHTPASPSTTPPPLPPPGLMQGTPGLQRPGAPTALRPHGPPANNNDSRYRLGGVAQTPRFGEYPDVPTSAVSSSPGIHSGKWSTPDGSPAMLPDTTSGGNAGMAGVGRRAFAAAAWSVRAGVALASATGRGFNPDGVEQMHMPMPTPSPSPPSGSRTAPPTAIAVPSPGQVSNGPTTGPNRIPRDPTPREPVIMPKAPLSGRRQPSLKERKDSISTSSHDHSSSRHDDYRSASRSESHRSISRNDEHRSFSRTDDSRASPEHEDHFRSMSRNDDYFRPAERKDDFRSISRTDDRAPSRGGSSPPRSELPTRTTSAQSNRSPTETKPPNFFERYRQMQNDPPALSSGIGPGLSSGIRLGSSPPEDVDTRAERRLSFDSLEDSSLPWAQPSPSESRFDRLGHQRYPTDSSVESATSSSASCTQGPGRSSSHETELVMTPSQSFEGLVERITTPADKDKDKSYGGLNPNSVGLGFGDSVPVSRSLGQIGEEEEDDDSDRYSLSAAAPIRLDPDLPRSSTQSTVRPHPSSPPSRYTSSLQDRPRSGAQPRSSPRSQDADRLGVRAPSTSPPTTSPRLGSSPPNGRPRRVCASCGESVGGARRFVERDGIILCEADWKKMYLPACRRCRQPIEKSAVSSSDGQLKGKWHRSCFTCTRCDRPFDGDDFYVHDGRPWCQYHYAEENGTLCASASCKEPIEGHCIIVPSADGVPDLRFHPGHLRCDHRGGVSGAQNCRESMEEYYDVNGERFCERHVGEAMRKLNLNGARAEKRRTRLGLVDLNLNKV